MYRNPYYKNLSPAQQDEESASYGGIAMKSFWYLALTLAGVGAFLWMPLVPAAAPLIIGLIAAAGLLPFLIYLMPGTAMMLGSVYCLAQGYLLGMICEIYAKQYTGIVAIALGITAIVFVCLLFLYSTGIVKVGHRLRSIMVTLVMGSVVLSAVVWISSFFTSTLSNLFWGNGAIGFAVAIAALLIAVINLVLEFDNVSKTVSMRFSKKYEWPAAYGLIFSIILLFLRILSLVAKVMSKGRQND